MRSVSEHREAILAALPPRAGAEVPLAECLGLITTADVVARVAHGLLYIAGVKLLFARSLAFAVGFASLFVILSRLV